MKRFLSLQLGFLIVLITFLGCTRSSDSRRLMDFKVEFGDNNIPGADDGGTDGDGGHHHKEHQQK